jgi:hypothetical protein
VADRVDEYADEHGVTDAEAVRRLVTHGLDHLEAEPTTAAEIRDELETLRRELYDVLDDRDDEPGATRARQADGGGVLEHVAGGLVGLSAIALVGGTILGPTVAFVTGLVGFGVAAYLVTVQAVRSYTEDTTA